MGKKTIDDKRSWSCWDEWERVTKELSEKFDLSNIYITCVEGSWKNELSKRSNAHKKSGFDEDDAETSES